MKRLIDLAREKKDGARHRGVPVQPLGIAVLAAELAKQIRKDGRQRLGVGLLVELASRRTGVVREHLLHRALAIQRGADTRWPAAEGRHP